MRRRSGRSSGVVVALLLAVSVGARAQTHEPMLTSETIRSYYRDLFDIVRVERRGRPGVSIQVAKLPADHILADLASGHRQLLAYVLKLADVTEDQTSAALADPTFPDSYLALLQQDEDFDSVLLEIVSRFVQGKGGVVRDHSPIPVRTFSEAQLLRVAVRFVYPDFLLDDGGFGAHICTTFNGLEDLSFRDPYLEALAYSTIAEETYREPSALLKKISAALELAKELELSGDKGTVLSRAQGVVWGDLIQSAELRSSLRQEYERIGHLLPISIQWVRNGGP